MVGAGCFALYEATFDRRWLDESRRLAEEALRLFWDERARGLLRHRASTRRALVVRPRNLFDNAVPSGTSVDHRVAAAARGRHRRGALRGASRCRRSGPWPISCRRYPSGFGRYLSALDFHLGPVAEVALVWPAGAERAAAPLAETVFRRYLPNRVVVGARGGRAGRGRAAAPGRARRGGRQADRVRLPPLRLPAPGDRPGRARAPARRWGIIRTRRWGRSPENRVRPGTPRTCTG